MLKSQPLITLPDYLPAELHVDERLQEVELKLMDLEIVVDQLNDVIIRHEQSIDLLTRQLNLYKQQLEHATSVLAPQSEETPPPHY